MLFIQSILESGWMLVAIMNENVWGWSSRRCLAGLQAPGAWQWEVPALQSSWTSHGRQGCLEGCLFPSSVYSYLSVRRQWVNCPWSWGEREECKSDFPWLLIYMTHWQGAAGTEGRVGRHITTGRCLILPWDRTHGWTLCGAEQGWEGLLQTEENRGGCTASITDSPPHHGGCCCCFCF